MLLVLSSSQNYWQNSRCIFFLYPYHFCGTKCTVKIKELLAIFWPYNLIMRVQGIREFLNYALGLAANKMRVCDNIFSSFCFTIDC